MRQIIVATHAHFADGIVESTQLLSGARDNVRALSMFVDGRDDVAAEAARILGKIPEADDLVICTDLLGGSVNNEFTKLVQARPNTHLVTNMNLPFLIQLLFAPEDEPTELVLRGIVGSDDTRVKYVNDLIAATADDEDEF